MSKTPLELASAVGVAAANLHDSCGGDEEVEGALKFLVPVNPELFAWLRDRLNAAIDAALAASAPQKEQRLHCQFCGADHLPYTCPKRPYSCCGRADPHEHGFGSAIPMPAPAQETERGR